MGTRLKISLAVFLFCGSALAGPQTYIDGDWEINIYVVKSKRPPHDLPNRVRATVRCKNKKGEPASRIITLKNGEIRAKKVYSAVYVNSVVRVSYERRKNNSMAKYEKVTRDFPVDKDCFKYGPPPGPQYFNNPLQGQSSPHPFENNSSDPFENNNSPFQSTGSPGNGGASGIEE